MIIIFTLLSEKRLLLPRPDGIKILLGRPLGDRVTQFENPQKDCQNLSGGFISAISDTPSFGIFS
jgi:hypothetical protein